MYTSRLSMLTYVHMKICIYNINPLYKICEYMTYICKYYDLDRRAYKR